MIRGKPQIDNYGELMEKCIQVKQNRGKHVLIPKINKNLKSKNSHKVI